MCLPFQASTPKLKKLAFYKTSLLYQIIYETQDGLCITYLYFWYTNSTTCSNYGDNPLFLAVRSRTDPTQPDAILPNYPILLSETSKALRSSLPFVLLFLQKFHLQSLYLILYSPKHLAISNGVLILSIQVIGSLSGTTYTYSICLQPPNDSSVRNINHPIKAFIIVCCFFKFLVFFL